MSDPPDLVSAFRDNVSRLDQRIAIHEPDRTWTWRELGGRADAVTETLRSVGVRPGHRVALMLPNSGAFVASFFAIARCGGVVAPFNVRYREHELVYYLRDTGAIAIVASPELTEVVGSASEGLESPPVVVEVAPGGACRTIGGAPPPSRPAAPQPKDPPVLHQYTSGSTGDPKRIVRTRDRLRWELGRLASVFDLGPEDRFLGVAPFSHVNGLVRTMMTSMFVGGTLYPMADFRRRPVLDLITRERITYFGGVPYMYAMLADTPVRGEVDLSSLRVAFSSSAPLLPDDNRRFAGKYGLYVRQLYGSTETGTISVNVRPDPTEKIETVGRPLPGIRWEVRDDDGRSLPPGEEGEVAIASPSAIREYDANPEANAASFRDGFYLSGDLGRLDPDGDLTLTGRKKFLINRGGYKVNPVEVEQVVSTHPKVREVVVLGAPSRFGDEIVRCVIVANEPCSAEEIVEHCRTRIADFKAPSRVEFRDELPKSATGKILRGKL